VFYSNSGLSVNLRDFEGPVLHVANDIRVVHLATNETLGVENGVGGVGVECVLSAVTNTVADTLVLKLTETGEIAYSLSSSVKLTQDGVIR